MEHSQACGTRTRRTRHHRNPDATPLPLAQSKIWVSIESEPPIHDRDGRAPLQLYRIDDLCFITSYNRKLDILLNGIASALLDDCGLPC